MEAAFTAGFNPRTPCGVRLLRGFMAAKKNTFQSTHSLRSATCHSGQAGQTELVSIHALLAECDQSNSFQARDQYRFNPRTPCGVRRLPAKWEAGSVRFQSTHSLRSATYPRQDLKCSVDVSIHALLAECDAIDLVLVFLDSGFNPRTPCGVRRPDVSGRHLPQRVSIHALLAECDFQMSWPLSFRPVSIHALLAECDSKPGLRNPYGNVSIHALLAECDYYQAA